MIHRQASLQCLCRHLLARTRQQLLTCCARPKRATDRRMIPTEGNLAVVLPHRPDTHIVLDLLDLSDLLHLLDLLDLLDQLYVMDLLDLLDLLDLHLPDPLGPLDPLDPVDQWIHWIYNEGGMTIT